jgi:hypothetical protein
MSRFDRPDNFPDVRTSGQGGAAASRAGSEDDPGMLRHPQSLIDQPVCGGRQRHARVRRDEGSEAVRHWRIEPYGCRRTFTHNYIVVDSSRCPRGAGPVRTVPVTQPYDRHAAGHYPAMGCGWQLVVHRCVLRGGVIHRNATSPGGEVRAGQGGGNGSVGLPGIPRRIV